MSNASTHVSVQPVLVSQHTAGAVLGFRSPRAYREWVISSGVPHVRRGLDLLVRVDDALRYLAPPQTPKTESDPVSDVDHVLEAIGRRRIR